MWLPDFKFGPGQCAGALARTPWHWETVRENLRLSHDEGEDLMIRHLVMPNHAECRTPPPVSAGSPSASGQAGYGLDKPEH